MTKSEFISLIENPAPLNNADKETLSRLVEEHPYFQSGLMLWLKKLKHSEDLFYGDALKIVASKIPDRAVLHDFLEIKLDRVEEQDQKKEAFIHKVDDREQPKATKESSTGKIQEAQKDIPKKLEQHIQSSATTYQYQLEKEIAKLPPLSNAIVKEETEVPDSSDKAKEKTAKPVSTTPKTPQSFTDWLNVSKQEWSSSPLKKEDPSSIIDRFIQSDPKISPAKKDASSNSEIPKKSVEDENNLVSDTLARIYMSQKNYDKAKATYEQLILKFPEKKGYFASQLKLIAELKEQKN